jgi:hypothetical protein
MSSIGWMMRGQGYPARPGSAALPPKENFLLNRLEPSVLAELQPHLSLVNLRHAEVLAETHQRIKKVYFPHSGIISSVVELVGGGAIGTATGVASVVSSDRIRFIANKLPAFREPLVKYEQFSVRPFTGTSERNLASVRKLRCMGDIGSPGWRSGTASP